MPYIPGKDVCGIIEAVDAGSKFSVGDCIVGSKDFEGHAGMAEHIVLQEARCALKPAGVNPLEAAACPDSAITALRAVTAAKIREGSRVLVLGGSGGVGSAAVQLAKLYKPSLVASTSTQHEMLKSLGVDQPIDYRSTNWWELEEFKKQPLDVIIDCVGGNNHFSKARAVLKSRWSGGRFVAVVGDDPEPLVQRIDQLLAFAMRMLWKPFWTLFCPWVPAHVVVVSGTEASWLEKVLGLMADGKLRIVLDPASPLPFDAAGVKRALEIQASHHAHGKVVVKIADE
jgi:NADPH:quinone reductase-like Zn-dependent oxidoreductase